jgi:ethanolaminephosphotransferase
MGFLLTVFNYILIAFYDYDFTMANRIHDGDQIPRWVFILAGINVFVAYTLDGIDGKQARRTGTSTPLGELFDHGLDSYSCIFIMIYLFSLFGTSDLPPLRMHFITYCVYMNFYVSMKTDSMAIVIMGLIIIICRIFVPCSLHILRNITRVFSFCLTPMTT